MSRLIILLAAAGAFLMPDVAGVQSADACGVKMSIKGSKVRQARASLEARRAKRTSEDRKAIAVGPIAVNPRDSISGGGGPTEGTQPEKRIENTPEPKKTQPTKRKRPKEVATKTPEPTPEPTPAVTPEPTPDMTPAEAKFNKEYSFENGSAAIGGDQMQMLRETAAWMKANPKKRLTVEGHASRVGSADTNQAISEARAAAVVDILVAEGVPAKRITRRGMGAKKPAYKPATDPRNRRVVLTAK